MNDDYPMFQDEPYYPPVNAEGTDDDVEFGQSPPEGTAEEAAIENKAALVQEFVDTCNRLVELIDELDVEEIVTDLDDLRDMVCVAKYPFAPDFDDHGRDDPRYAY